MKYFIVDASEIPHILRLSQKSKAGAYVKTVREKIVIIVAL